MKLIDADALMEQMKHRREFVGRLSDPVCLVEDAPTIEPVRHGHWITMWDVSKLDPEKGGRCSECGKISGAPTGNFCKWCGAKMDEVTP